MPDPTLEQIAAGGFEFVGTDRQRLNMACDALALAAREIIALRGDHNDAISYLDGLHTLVCKRLDQLESQARPFQESGELAVGREGNWQCRAEMAEARLSDSNAKCLLVEVERDEALRSAAIAKQDAQMFGGNYEVMLARVKEYEAERDAAIARADEAERDLVEAVATTKTTATARDEYYRRFKSVEAERDVARDALRKIADPNIGLKYVRIIAKEALDGSGQHE